MMKACRLVTALTIGLAGALSPAKASAGVESHVVGDDVRIVVDRAGGATVEETIALRVQNGVLRSVDLTMASAGVEPLGGSVSSTDRDRAMADFPLDVTTTPAGLHLGVAATGGMAKGSYAVRVRYRKNLRRAGQLRDDGAMTRVEWSGVRWDDGFDNARCTFVVPAGASAPLVVGAALFAGEPRLKRGAGTDEVELVRAHVARGEIMTWGLRADPRAFDDDTAARPLVETKAPSASIPSPVGHARELGLLGALMLAFSALVGAKAKRARADALGNALPKPLLPLPAAARVLLAGPALAGGAALQFWLENPWWGTCLVALAMAAGAYRLPAWLPRPRGPGRWLALTDGEAFDAGRHHQSWFARIRSSGLDASTWTGRACLLVALLGCAALAVAASRSSAYAGYLVLIDAVVLLPIFGTALRRDLPPDPVLDIGPVLGRMARELRNDSGLRVVAWGRVAADGDRVDEVRLLCVPRQARKGLNGIEIGLVPANGAGGRVDWPEVLVRVTQESASHRALAALMPERRWTAGRKPQEAVACLRPALPTLAMTLALARRLVAAVQLEARVVPLSPGKAEATSPGSGERTSNASTSASPFQAM